MRAFLFLSAGVLALSACTDGVLDLDMRDLGKGFDTTDAANAQTAARPAPDSRGVITYPNYQVVVARNGETVGSIATRLGISADALARANGLPVNAQLTGGELLVLPTKIAAPAATVAPAAATAAVTTGAVATDRVDIQTLAGGAIDRAQPPKTTTTSAPATATTAPAAKAAPSGAEPVRHKVQSGETVYSISRIYNVSPKSLAEWNGLGPDLEVRTGQVLLIPVVVGAAAPAPNVTTAPGVGSPTPTPPSAATPLPEEKTAPVGKTTPEATAAAPAKAPGTPASPDLAKDKTPAKSTAQMATPVQGSIVRDFSKGKNDGIDISAPAGTTVVAAQSGVVAAITRDTDQVPILVLRHDGGLLTVYANVDNLKVEKGQTVNRGQPIAVVRETSAPFLHFEVREGVEAKDPTVYID